MSELPAKTVIEGYEIVETIGSGSTGRVYRARGQSDGSIVAIKVIHSEVAGNALTRGRFEREALAASRVDHPSCVKVHNVGLLDDGRFYLVMDFVEGISLADEILKGKLEVERALRIADDILAGLETAHAADVIHRDIKPANIRLERDGDRESARILDFGLAKLIGAAGASTEPLTAAGMAVGTPTYMPPEWLTSGELGPRSDLYSLSVVLYEMIGGEPPFLADEPLQTLTKHVQEPVPELPLAEGQPAAQRIRELVAGGLEKDPEKRYENAGAFRQAIAVTLTEIRDKATLLMTAIPKVAPAGAEPAAPSPIDTEVVPDVATEPPPPVTSDRALPPVPTPQAAVALPAHQPATVRGKIGRWARRYKRPLIASAAGLALLGAVIAATGGSDPAVAHDASAGKVVGSQSEPSENIDEVMERWDDAGLEPGGFAPVDPPPHGAQQCKTGAASGLDLTVCEFASEKAAQSAEKGARKSIGTHTGAAVTSGTMLLIVADRKGVDPTGESINKLINQFAGVSE